MTSEHGDHHDDHEHGEFIAHHFESAEQQFDAGKLGIWAFLVTEVLFFTGLFCAYVLYRFHHPEIFVQAHHFLDKILGGGNTIVLLFSSLTMALAVRASQLGQNRTVATMVLVTMVCASIFLGVKAVEYSHKWDIGIFVRAHFSLDESHHPKGISPYLTMISIIPLILLFVFGAMALLYRFTNSLFRAAFWGGMTLMVAGYFIGAIGGYFYMKVGGGDAHSTAGKVIEHHDDHADGHDPGDDHAQESASESQPAGGAHDHETRDLHHDIGIFFSIYYCMTGLHAIHVVGGIVALAWIFYRSLLGHWRSDYFGPVDYVGLYWHLVDLIWIFLFPLLYLIN